MSIAQGTGTVSGTASRYRWVVLTLCWLSFTMTSVDRSTWGPASVFVGKALAVPLASLGAFATAYYIGYVLSNALGGFASDRFGSRYTLTISLVGAGAFMMVFGATTSAAIGIAVQAVVGLFAGADYSAGVKLLASWFRPDQLGLVMGVFTAATSLGTVIANAVVPSLIEKSGWHTSYHLFGLISIVVGVVLFLVVRPGPVTGEHASPARRGSTLAALVRNRDLVLLALAGFGGFWGTYGFITWSNTLMIKGHGVSPKTAGAIVAVFAATAVIGKPLVGLIADRFGGARKVPSIVILALFVVTLIVFGSLGNVTGFFVVAPVLGLAAYCYLPLIVAMTPQLVESRLVGTAAGACNAFWQLGSVLVPLAVGAVFQATNSFLAAFLTLSAGPLIGLLLMLPIKERATRTPVETS
ncbi:MFS transporter [Amycolatopsis acidiphila]|uniref:MFS transporter n=1 Tax=Amycolatopsis acidiphila TaxID=715473 RepID=UPI0019A64880|nr:MFS transporter [Amycolatopsis acidiphila]UIJ57525.1 MFS transporter [Amycolatopsis acidiphila]GHG89282.1 MFS transporter [Amycolatopsis acidiphila]